MWTQIDYRGHPQSTVFLKIEPLGWPCGWNTFMTKFFVRVGNMGKECLS